MNLMLSCELRSCILFLYAVKCIGEPALGLSARQISHLDFTTNVGMCDVTRVNQNLVGKKKDGWFRKILVPVRSSGAPRNHLGDITGRDPAVYRQLPTMPEELRLDDN